MDEAEMVKNAPALVHLGREADAEEEQGVRGRMSRAQLARQRGSMDVEGRRVSPNLPRPPSLRLRTAPRMEPARAHSAQAQLTSSTDCAFGTIASAARAEATQRVPRVCALIVTLNLGRTKGSARARCASRQVSQACR